MILKVIPYLILKKAHLIAGSPRMISSDNLLEIWALIILACLIWNSMQDGASVQSDNKN